ncbi:VWA domain-containing protein [Nakamurella flavida]|uniref:VWA domain-containing protein n=1 Tax=Nakamurella flavida TaxID=363630 RepID=A0A939C410_9ACTN|nr:VWA domain-containing protein [Nakamurella flavida]MBM9475184.1 VWA domain-containing protein [Nakamurella flavida]MDP9776757.1 Ca-activated chloride channel family protein [Nakamurella flavida]
MSFAHPVWFAAGALVLLLLVGYVLAQRRSRRHTLRFANLELLERVAPRRPGRRRHLPTALVLVGLISLTVALAGPTAEAKVPRNEATVMLAIDVSLSMEATDVSPNRLEAAQEAATQFVDDLTPGVNLGIVSFAGIATVLVAPTPDRAAAKAAIASLKLDERTATGEAIISCLQTIESFSRTLAGAGATAQAPTADGSTPDGSSQDGAEAPTTVPARIVLMTDGKRTVGRTEQDAAQRAADAKIPVSVIAFGTDNGSIDFQGERIPVPLDTASMQEIAQISGGDFHTAATTAELKSVYAELGEQIGYETQEKDVSRPWLIAGTIIVVLGAGAALVIGGRIP